MKTSEYLDNESVVARHRITTYQVECDGQTVWLNSPSFCIARFRQTGMDIYAPPLETKSELLLLETWENAALSNWELFKSKIKEFFGINISDDYMPHVEETQ